MTEKVEKQRRCAERHSSAFENRVFMFWSPNVPVGTVGKADAQIRGLQVVINGENKRRIQQLRAKARLGKQDTGNLAFRVYQITRFTA